MSSDTHSPCLRCSQPVPAKSMSCPACNFHLGSGEAPDAWIGEILHQKYEIEEVLGVGGMGMVFKAKRRLLGDYVGIKILFPRLLKNALQRRLFQDEAIATIGHISDWDVSAVTNMADAFSDRYSFNEDISGWDVSSVTDMSGMFYYTEEFNQPLGGWDVSSVINMEYMFGESYAFNQDISGWNVSSVTNMTGMFYYAEVFDQPLGTWDVSSVTNDLLYLS